MSEEKITVITTEQANNFIERFNRFARNSSALLEHIVDDRMVANRNLDLLTPETRALALEFLELAKQEWHDIFITETRRSQERQDMLYEQGRTTPGNRVTWTKVSSHTKWIAIDFAFEPSVYGSAYPDDEKLRAEVWALGESVGFRRWGRWRMPDKPHLQNGR